MRANELGPILFLGYLLALMGLLLSSVILEFFPARRPLGRYLFFAALGSIPGFFFGCMLAVLFVNSLLSQESVKAGLPKNPLLIEFLHAIVPCGIAGVITLLFAGAAVWFAYARRKKLSSFGNLPERV